MRHSEKRNNTSKPPKDGSARASPPIKKQSILTEDQIDMITLVGDVCEDIEAGKNYSPNELKKLTTALTTSFDVLDMGVAGLHGALAVYYFFRGEWYRGVAALASMFSAVRSILKRNAKKIITYFKGRKKAGRTKKPNDSADKP